MTSNEKIKIIQGYIGSRHRDIEYHDLLRKLGDEKFNYRDYMISEPINCNFELRRLDEADYDLTTALYTMMLREDHFSNGSLERRIRLGQVDRALERMVELLKDEDGTN